MRKSFAFIALFICALCLSANDGVYFASGSFLVPVEETEIAVSSEVLDITLGKDGYAYIDVKYVFQNNGPAKKLTMAFEANPPYNAGKSLDKRGIHPFIFDFSVEMNGTKLSYRNAVVDLQYAKGRRVDRVTKPLDLSKWKGAGEADDDKLPVDNTLYNSELDSVVSFAYAYFFDASFKQGRNTVHHRYRYKMGYMVGTEHVVPYWLTPATRWAGHRIGDFTMNIRSKRGDEFCFCDTLFNNGEFSTDNGMPFYRVVTDQGKYLLANVGTGTLTWHAKNFSPKADFEICSADRIVPGLNRTFNDTSGKVVVSKSGEESGRYIGKVGNNYLVSIQDYGLVSKDDYVIKEVSARNGEGCLVLKGNSTVNVRQRPTTESAVIAKIKDEEGELPEVYPCLGMADGWFRIKVGNKTGYVRADLMLWDSINSY